MAMPNLEAALAAEHTISNKKAAVKNTQTEKGIFGEFLPKKLLTNANQMSSFVHLWFYESFGLIFQGRI